jgi:hypothetical protein
MGGPDGRPRPTVGHLHIIDREGFNVRVPSQFFFCTYLLLAFLFLFPPRLVFIALSIIV